MQCAARGPGRSPPIVRSAVTTGVSDLARCRSCRSGASETVARILLENAAFAVRQAALSRYALPSFDDLRRRAAALQQKHRSSVETYSLRMRPLSGVRRTSRRRVLCALPTVAEMCPMVRIALTPQRRHNWCALSCVRGVCLGGIRCRGGNTMNAAARQRHERLPGRGTRGIPVLALAPGPRSSP